MAPPPPSTSVTAPAVYPVIREVTEDTPPDFLEGTMELLVVLPSAKSVRMTVDRRTPMMDLLIQVGTVNKINPGDHIVQVRNERNIELPYKPSTPIGALDTTTIEIVPKNRVNEYIIVKKPAKLANQPFEHTFRLQVHLPRNQLYVMRVSMKTGLELILKEVCQEKNLDFLKYEIRHPVNLDEKLPLSSTLGDFGLQEVTVVSKNTKINSSVSTADIMALQQTDESRAKGYMDSSFKHSRSSVGDSSVSSGSTGSARGLSPTRSDDSRSVSPLAHMHSMSKLNHRTSNISSCSSSGIHTTVQKASSMSNMFSPSPSSNKTETLPTGIKAPPRSKKRAPPPPPLLKSQTESSLSISSVSNAITQITPVKPTPRKKEAPRLPPKSKTFDSSFQDQSVVSVVPANHSRHSSGSSGFNESLIISTQNEPHRFDRQISCPAMLSKQAASNLTTVSSVSSTSLASSTGGSKKRRAPPPPPVIPQSEIEEEDSEASSLTSHGLISSKSDKSRQSSVEVEVDVHSDPKHSTDASSSSRISTHEIKDEEMLSSSAASSLSSPGSSSASTSSSPLPRTDSPNSKSALNNDSSSTKAFSSSNPSNNYYPAEDEAGSNFPSIDVPGRSSNAANPGSTQASTAPLPPPRTKSREILLVHSLEEVNTRPEPKPRPKPKPRPDRVSVDNLIADNPIIIKPKADTESIHAEPAPVLSSQLRNPMSKYGVKVLPDNVLHERAQRLAQKESLEADEFINKVETTPKKAAAPPPPVPSKLKSSVASKSSNISVLKSDPKENVSVILSNKSQNEKSHYEKPKSKPRLKSTSSMSTEYDSDNLEVNLELFEPIPISRKPPSATRLIDRKSPHSSLTSTTDSYDEYKSSISSQGASEIPGKPKPKAKPVLSQLSVEGSRKTLVMSSSVSDFKNVKETVDSPNVEMSPKETEGFTRTYSDRPKSKDKKSNISEGPLLNRWQNLVSLNEIDDLSIKNASHATKPTTNILPAEVSLNTSSNYTKNLQRQNLNNSGRSSSTEDVLLDVQSQTAHDDGDDAAITSSESEVSYTDSGVPATETITPSPMDFDARISDDGESSPSHLKKEHDSRRSSPRSSFHSDDGDQWRNVLEAKEFKSQESMEKTFASMIPDNFGDNQRQSIEYAKPSADDSGAEDSVHTSTSDEEIRDNEFKSNKRNSETKKLSKAESFSHNSEFDIVNMKRLKYASGANMKSDSKRGNSTVDLRSSYSSSEEDLRSTTKTQERFQENLGTNNGSGSETIKEPRATSMHNLTSSGGHSGDLKEREHQRRLNDDKSNNHSSIKKTTSLLEIQKLEPDTAGNTDIMKAFHSQLEAQFEQWKVDFLQKHMTGASVISSTEPIQSPSQVEITSNEHQQESNSMSEKPPANKYEKPERKEDFLVIQESFVKTPEVLKDSQTVDVDSETHSISDCDNEEPPSEIPISPFSAGLKESDPTPTTSPTLEPSIVLKVNEEREMNKSVEVRDKKMMVQNSAPVYRYSGPPTINMGSWTERPRSTVAVKKDQDYIMGFGQVDTKSTSTDSKPIATFKVGNVSSYRGNSTSQEPTVVTSPTETNKVSSLSTSNNKSSTPYYPSKGLSATLNARPIPSESSESESGSIKSVLSTWKQRVSENEKERQIPHGPPPEIDIYGTESEVTQRRETHNVVNSTKTVVSAQPYKIDQNIPSNVILETKLDQTDSMSFSASKSIFNRSNKPYENGDENNSSNSEIQKNTTPNNHNGVKKQNSFNIQTVEPAKKEIKNSSTADLRKVKPMLFQMSSMEQKPVSRIQSFSIHSSTEDSVDQKFQKIQEENSSNNELVGQSLQEKKKYFQGIKPVESSSKEAPMPAVNMKSSIATIQKVFEQRQQLQKHQASPVQRSMTLPSHTVHPTLASEESTSPVISQQITSSTMPKHFQTMSSTEMVQKVLGRPAGYNYEAFRRSPSPVSSTTSTLSRTSSSGRGTPSSTTNTDGQENIVKISQEYKKIAPTQPTNIQNVGNKAIIIVNGSDYTSKDGEIKRQNNVSGSIFKLQMKVNNADSEQNPSVKSNLGSTTERKNSFGSSSTKIVINESPVKRMSNPSVKVSENASLVKSTPLEQTIKETKPVSIKTSMTNTSVKKISLESNRKSISTDDGFVPPPPPPPTEGLKLKPSDLAISNKSQSLTSVPNSKASTPTSPAPMTDIFNAIKNSNGSFGLKKTGSSFLLK